MEMEEDETFLIYIFVCIFLFLFFVRIILFLFLFFQLLLNNDSFSLKPYRLFRFITTVVFILCYLDQEQNSNAGVGSHHIMFRRSSSSNTIATIFVLNQMLPCTWPSSKSGFPFSIWSSVMVATAWKHAWWKLML